VTATLPPVPHPICAQIRQLRKAAGYTLADVERRHGVKAIVLASWERGDRHPSIEAVDAVLGFFGLHLAVMPINAVDGHHHTRTPAEIGAALRGIANQVDPPDGA